MKNKKNKQIHTGILFVLGMLIALSPFSIDMYLPAFPAIARSLHTSVASVGYSLTSYFGGLCIGQLIYGVLIDRYGRKKPLMIGLTIYLAAGICCALCTGIGLLVIVRIFMALGGCVGMVAARAMVRDLYPPEEMAKILSLLILAMGVAPIIAPTVGGLINTWLGWRWVFGVMSLFGVLLMLGVHYILAETKAPDKHVSLKIKDILPPYFAVLKNRRFLIYTLAGGISYAGMYAYIAGSPFVFMQKFGLSVTAYGWAFSLNACGLITGSQLNRLALKRYTSAAISRNAGIMLFLTGFSLLLITYTSYANVGITLTFTFLFLFWIGFINPNTTALALSPFTSSTGRASALLGSIQMVAGVIASWLVSFLNNGTIIIMPAVMFFCTLISVSILVFNRKRVLIKQQLSTTVD